MASQVQTYSLGKRLARKPNVSAASVVVTQHRTTAKKSRYLAVFEQKLPLKVVSVAKVKPKDSEGWWIQGLKRVFKKRPTSTLAQKKQTKKW